ncbi:unnamed protein product [Coregonus sp. 'balchen']|nr:unnamed protein product [Coregonus sp. 'balchen']
MAHPHTPLTATATDPHLTYYCQEGANVTLPCAQRGDKLHHLDHLPQRWLFTPHSNDHCEKKMHPRGHLHQGNHSRAVLPWGVHYGANEKSFWVQLQFVNKSDQGPSVTAGVATAACIMAILTLPVILVLVYKQRQSAQSSRRAHELVRMDSEAAGHENPVFLGGSPPGQAKTRTVSQIMTRQQLKDQQVLLI